MRSPKIIAAFTLVAASLPIANAQTTAPALSGDQVVERVSPSAVSILVGKGDGQVAGGASWVFVPGEGGVLTAHPVVKGRGGGLRGLKNGENYQQGRQIASGERRASA